MISHIEIFNQFIQLNWDLVLGEAKQYKKVAVDCGGICLRTSLKIDTPRAQPFDIFTTHHERNPLITHYLFVLNLSKHAIFIGYFMIGLSLKAALCTLPYRPHIMYAVRLHLLSA